MDFLENKKKAEDWWGLLRRSFNCSRKETIICNTRVRAKEASVREGMEGEMDG